jgi:hypothetical protein
VRPLEIAPADCYNVCIVSTARPSQPTNGYARRPLLRGFTVALFALSVVVGVVLILQVPLLAMAVGVLLAVVVIAAGVVGREAGW